MTLLNSADFRNNFAEVLETLAKKREPVFVGRFGQPKAVLMDIFTYNWQSQVVKLLQKMKTGKLNLFEIETLNILLDDSARESLFAGLKDIEEGNVVPFSND